MMTDLLWRAGWSQATRLRQRAGALASEACSRSGLVRHLRGTDLALCYALVLVVLTVLIQLRPASLRDRFVLDSSTNLANLRERPIYVLIVSAFVIPSWGGLTVLFPLVVVYTAAQRWIGRLATTIAAVIGHVGATLFVAVLLTAGVSRGRLEHSVAHAPDVGVSYGLIGLLGLLAARVGRPWRPWYAAALLVYCTMRVMLAPTFTAVGHLSALALGFGLALLASRVARASLAEHGLTPAGPPASCRTADFDHDDAGI
jgi:hypothetical protein